MYFHKVDELSNMDYIKGIRVKKVSSSKVRMTFMEVEAGVEIPKHQHFNEQVTMVLKGKALVYVNGCEKLLGPGEICVIPANLVHGINVLEDNTIMYDCLHSLVQESQC